MSSQRASLLTIPCELRNHIYAYLFDPELDHAYTDSPTRPGELAVALKLQDPAPYLVACHNANRSARKLALLQTCKQIHDEAHLMALSLTPFHVSGDSSYPGLFDLRSRPLSRAKLGAIRQLTLTARISHLRALNEAWSNLPFGHPSLHLDKLTIVPNRAEVHAPALAEIADLSQSHTLAYIFCETLKGLRHVKCIEVLNQGCFNEVVWKLFYRSLIYRLWRWGGADCGIRFESGEEREGGNALGENQWFRAYLDMDERRGSDCGEEVFRMVGGASDMSGAELAAAANI